MGIPMCRTFGGWMREGDDEEETFGRIVSSIKECAEYAESKKVLIGLHNHNHGQIPATGEMVIRLLDAVDSPYFVGLLDTGQWYGSPGIGEGTTAYGKPDGKHGSPRGTIDPEYDYLDSIKTAANSGRLVQVRAKIFCRAESVATHPAHNIFEFRFASRSIGFAPARRTGSTTTPSPRS